MRFSFRDVYDVIWRNEGWDHWDTLAVALDVWCDLNKAGRAL